MSLQIPPSNPLFGLVSFFLLLQHTIVLNPYICLPTVKWKTNKQTPLYSLIRMGLNLILHREFGLWNNKALLTEPHMGVMTPCVCSSVRVCSFTASSHNTQQGVLRHVMQYVCSYQADLFLADSGDRRLHSITGKCGKDKQPRNVLTGLTARLLCPHFQSFQSLVLTFSIS